ncbi:MAG: DivIVA domain-containing protein [Methanobacteriaceae archaeon]|nr:DivIVA domain-containing protein [Methanobacteriaceae archaeon]
MNKFTINENGYDVNEVNQFVDKVANEYEKTLSKLREKDSEIDRLNKELEHFHDLESTLNKAVMVAEDSSMQIKKVAREEAKLIIDDAKKNASHIVNDALIKAEKVELEADQLRRSLKIYKSRIKQAVSEQLTIVEDVEGIEIEE